MRFYLRSGKVIDGDLIFGGYASIALVKAEFSHVHPTPEFINLSGGMPHSAPLSSDDLSMTLTHFSQLYPHTLFTIRAVVSNGYAYENSWSHAMGKRISREKYWELHGLPFRPGAGAW